MRHCGVLLILATIVGMHANVGIAQKATFHVLAFYSTKVEQDHVDFATEALAFFVDLAKRDRFEFQSTTQWDDLNPERLKDVQVVLWLNEAAHTPAQQSAFEQYMRNGGGWLGFHAAAYNDADTHWPWFVKFLGGSVFYGNNWPPLPALLRVETSNSPVIAHLPSQFAAPSNEWYIWKPSPRLNRDVQVLVTLDPSNYPLGLKDTLLAGDLPVVWTNTKYRMLYMNMGHGDKIFTSETQNRMFEDGLLWLGTRR